MIDIFSVNTINYIIYADIHCSNGYIMVIMHKKYSIWLDRIDK